MFRYLQPNYSRNGDEQPMRDVDDRGSGGNNDDADQAERGMRDEGQGGGGGGGDHQRYKGVADRFFLSNRMVSVIQIIVCIIFVYLWFTADTSQGSLSRPLWYASAIALAILSTSNVCSQSRVSWVGILPFIAPLVFIMLYETIVKDMDRGTTAIQLPLWIGRILSIFILAVVSYAPYSAIRSMSTAASPTSAAAGPSFSASSSFLSPAARILGSGR